MKYRSNYLPTTDFISPNKMVLTADDINRLNTNGKAYPDNDGGLFGFTRTYRGVGGWAYDFTYATYRITDVDVLDYCFANDAIYVLLQDGSLWGKGYSSSSKGMHITSSTDFMDWHRISPGPFREIGCNNNAVFAIAEDNTLWVQGTNSSGTGLGVTSGNAYIQQIGTANDWLTIAVGIYNVLGLRGTTLGEATLWTFGLNVSYSTGLSISSGATTTPSQIGSKADYNFIAVGQGGNLVRDAAGQWYAFGANTSGCLGNGGTAVIQSPTAVTLPANVVEVAIGTGHTIVRTSEGKIWTAGGSYLGRAGTGNAFLQANPTDKTFVTIMSTYGYNMAATADGEIYISAGTAAATNPAAIYAAPNVTNTFNLMGKYAKGLTFQKNPGNGNAYDFIFKANSGNTKSTFVPPKFYVYTSGVTDVFLGTTDMTYWLAKGQHSTNVANPIAISVNTSGYAFRSPTESFVPATTAGKVYRTREGRRTWDLVNFTGSTTTIARGASSTDGSTIILTGANRDIIRSTNGGDSFTAQAAAFTGSGNAGFPAHGNGRWIVASATGANYCYSDDNGATWSIATHIGGTYPVFRYFKGNWYYTAPSSSSPPVYRSSTGISGWTAVSTAMGFQSQAMETNGDILIISGQNGKGAYSYDGENWTPMVIDPVANVDVRRVMWLDNMWAALAATNRLYTSVDGIKWNRVSVYSGSRALQTTLYHIL